MALDPSQLHPNAKLEYGGNDVTVLQYDATMTYLANEDGEVKIYQTQSIMDDASVVQSEAERAAQEQADATASQDAQAHAEKDAEIARLQEQLASLQSSDSNTAPVRNEVSSADPLRPAGGPSPSAGETPSQSGGPSPAENQEDQTVNSQRVQGSDPRQQTQ